jgi:hypothetical protein
MIRHPLLALLAFLCAAQTAIAAPCKTQGSATATELLLNLRDGNAVFGTRISFYLSLLDKETPADDIAKIAAPCSRGKPAGLAKPVELFGENTDTPPRWASVSGERLPYFFVADMPRPGPARLWFDTPEEKRGRPIFKKGEWMSALIVIGKNERRLALAFFDDTPTDDRLISMVKEYETGARKPLVGLDVETKTFSVNPVE